MSAEFGFAAGPRRVPTVDGYETIELMTSRGHFAALSPEEQAKTRAYLEGPIGRLICALEDASDAATESRNHYAMAGIRGALKFARDALAEVAA